MVAQKYLVDGNASQSTGLYRRQRGFERLRAKRTKGANRNDRIITVRPEIQSLKQVASLQFAVDPRGLALGNHFGGKIGPIQTRQTKAR